MHTHVEQCISEQDFHPHRNITSFSTHIDGCAIAEAFNLQRMSCVLQTFRIW